MKIFLSDDWVELCDARPWYDQLMTKEAFDGETCLEICKNHKSCAKANWYKTDADIGRCRMFTMGAAACDKSGNKPEYSAELLIRFKFQDQSKINNSGKVQ